jgi:hypothetical protein
MPLRKRRWIFGTLVALLALQLLVIVALGEPYPALWAPAFPGGNQTGTYVTPEITFTFADGSEQTIPPPELLSEFPDSHHRALMKFFAPKPERPDRRALTALIRKWLPGYKKGRLERDQNEPAIWSWFVERSEPLFARSDVQRVRVDWRVYREADHALVGDQGSYEVRQPRDR